MANTTATLATVQTWIVRILKSFGISSPQRPRRIPGIESQSAIMLINQMRDPTNQKLVPTS
tara:strand:+ start:679 stop:861 length:183 start_codon:yes stop_codon:yes gene_type:complete